MTAKQVSKIKRVGKSTALKRVGKITVDKDHRQFAHKRMKKVKNINSRMFPNVRNKPK